MKPTYTHILPTLLIGAASLLCSSCDDWLDVAPKAQVEDTDLFSDESGYKEALAGVYSAMVNDRTYTKEMLFGGIDVLAQVWDHYPSGYEDLADYNYTASASESLIASLWQANYNAIANVNNLLGHIDGDRGLFARDNYNIIKGEALALRAFLHFDLLRCFGVSYAQNPHMPAIPYYTQMTNKVAPQLSVSQVAGKVMQDLQEADSLLQSDPIVTGEEITELIDNGYLKNRQVHLNYYAVKGLQARVYMWMGLYVEARACAREVLASGRFSWSNSNEMMAGTDYAFAPEQLFALHDINLSTISNYYFNSETQLSSFTLAPDRLNSYYDPTDYRFLYQFAASVTGEWECCLKYSPGKSSDSYYTDKIPLIRLGEMQLIVAECDHRIEGDGLDALNELREARGVLPYTAPPADFMRELIYEYRRELIGEGQLFFLNKRLNQPGINGSDADMIGEKAYTFPLPKSETEFAERQENR